MKLFRIFLVIALVVAVSIPSLAVAKKKEIVIGACQPLTGRFAFAGKHIHAGLRDFIDWQNSKGGVLGYKLKYVFEDSGYQLNKAIAAFKRIMAKYNPMFMYGESTGQGKALAREIKDRYKCIYGSTSFSSELANPKVNPYVFVSGPTYADMFGILLKYIAAQGKKLKKTMKVGFFYSNTEFGKDPIPFAKKFAKKLGIKVVYESVAKVGAINIASQVMRMRMKKPDYVIFQGFVLSPVPQVIKQAREAGLNTKFMATFWGMGMMVLKKLGKLAEGFMGVMQYPYWYEKAGWMQTAMKKYNLKKGVKYRPSYYNQGWVTGMIYAEILRRAIKATGGKVTRASLAKALASIKNWDTGGMLGGKVSIKNNKFAYGRVYKADVKAGKFVPVSGIIKLD